MNTLFIGGPRDGLRRAIPPNVTGCAIQIPILINTRLAQLGIGFTTHTYQLHQKQLADGTTIQLAVDSSVKDIEKQLIKGYRYHRNPRRK